MGGSTRWLSIIGMGEDGLDGLSPAAKHLIAQAEFIVGGARHLALAGPVRAQTLAWPSPVSAAFPEIAARRGTPVAVLASGDPFYFGIGSLLTQIAGADEMLCLPAPSAFSLAASRLGWALQDCALISLHGRALETLLPHVQPGARILALSWDGTTPRRAAQFLRARGCGGSRLTVLEAMGGPREKITECTADTGFDGVVDPLNLLAIDVVCAADARILPLAAGLPDHYFEHDGQITKRHIRAITLSALAPRKGELVWDIGSGSGSVAIEWMLRHPANRAIAVEKNPERAARIERNGANLGVPGLVIRVGRAPEALAGLDSPDAVFIGGGISREKIFDAAWAALKPGGRLAANAVTLEGQAELMRRFHAHGGDLSTIAVSHAEPVGAMHGWRPTMPVTHYCVVKPA